MSRGVRWFSRGLCRSRHAGRMRPGLHAICGEREPWRREAEVACLNSGTVKESAGLVRISPIEGPGMCGADFPLKVSALGEGSALGYVEEPVRPPGAIPHGEPSGRRSRAGRSRSSSLIRPRSPMRRRRAARRADVDRSARHRAASAVSAAAISAARCSARRHPICRRRRIGSAAPAADATAATIRCRHAVARAAGRNRRRRRIAALCAAGRGADGTAADRRRPLPPLGPPRDPQPAAGDADRDQAHGDARLPDRVGARSLVRQRGAAGGAQVVQSAGGRDQADLGLFVPRHERPGRCAASPSTRSATRSTSPPSCWPTATASRSRTAGKARRRSRAFSATCRRSACDQFTTVLAPGSNQFHYDHIHVDLMRRASGRRICQPGAVDGEVVASLARKNPRYAVAADRAAADAALRSAGRAGQRSVRLARRRPPRRPGHHRLDRRAAARSQGPGGRGPRLGRGARPAAGDRLEQNKHKVY